jgi:predicted GNAT family N-acyltransferase
VPFYASHGFVAFGEEFMEADIPHVAMARDL